MQIVFYSKYFDFFEFFFEFVFQNFFEFFSNFFWIFFEFFFEFFLNFFWILFEFFLNGYEARGQNSPDPLEMVKKPSASNFFSPSHIDSDFNRYSLSWASFWMYSKVKNSDFFNFKKIKKQNEGATRHIFPCFWFFFQIQSVLLVHVWIHSKTT